MLNRQSSVPLACSSTGHPLNLNRRGQATSNDEKRDHKIGEQQRLEIRKLLFINSYLSHDFRYLLLRVCGIRWKWDPAEVSDRSEREPWIFHSANTGTYL